MLNEGLMNPVIELNNIVLNNKIPNALLFTGNCGQDKKNAAILFAKAINCLNKPLISDSIGAVVQVGSYNKMPLSESLPCNSCRSCMKIDSKMHPDIITISPEPEKDVIKIAQIRELFSSTSSKPHEAKMRMVMIEEAHTMNQEAANALLKILEEPPERTFFILLARELNELLPTIISRCRHLRFKPISQDDVAQRLIQDFNISPLFAKIASKSSNGDINKATMFVNINSNIEWIKRRQWLFNQILMLIKPNQSSSLKFLYALVLAEKLSKETELLQDSISLLKLCLRDIALIKTALVHFNNICDLDKSILGKLINSEIIVNLDFVNLISDIVVMLPKNYHLMALDAIHKAESKLQTNASARLVLEQFFLSLIPSKS
ncbi:MAG: DNA polymerase III subunit delta' [Desulfamplus sp.]|nr:DNA polymerase III subunit delta' [Desulfamplus sp.]